MNARMHAKWMLWVGVGLIAVSVIGSVILQPLTMAAGQEQSALAVLFRLSTLLTWMLTCGCAFLAVSFPTRALDGRQISVRHRRPLATILLLIGIGCVVVGLIGDRVVAGVNDVMMMSNTGQDLLFTVGTVFRPLLTQALPFFGTMLIPASFLQRMIEQDSASSKKIFSGSAPE
ncbi:hypothetical protein [Paramicrobacterium chengjingii]|uniref:DUF2798 domain-containing protein n=1 Tax=Paramicrobacterium chengjingii TaxID=2769067 RepID=A0ABX6YFK9_9MICO|nr:hypothetical protein [Microbacterium chengjingii]QPZ37187.1 hypothetical protein HCR76_09965 [Microbacterium chengjingii]